MDVFVALAANWNLEMKGSYLCGSPSCPVVSKLKSLVRAVLDLYAAGCNVLTYWELGSLP